MFASVPSEGCVSMTATAAVPGSARARPDIRPQRAQALQACQKRQIVEDLKPNRVLPRGYDRDDWAHKCGII
jgi:hypothetical protein